MVLGEASVRAERRPRRASSVAVAWLAVAVAVAVAVGVAVAVAVAVAVTVSPWRWCGTATGCGYVVHTQAWCQRGFIARERREHIQILLDAANCRQPVVAGHPVDHRQRIRAFGQQYLELACAGPGGLLK